MEDHRMKTCNLALAGALLATAALNAAPRPPP